MPGVILVIEDEPGIVDFLERGLRAHGFQVQSALDGVTGTEKALNEDVDLIVLDMMLPGRTGLEVLTTVHAAKPSVPVVILTARGDIEDRVTGLDAGAVDYLTKPFSLSELAARIRAQLRVAAQNPATTITGGDIEVNLLTREVRRGGEPVRLSTTEFELLVYLMRNRGQVLSREQILRAVWGYEYDPGTNVVDVYIGYLRRKLRRREKPDATVAAPGQPPEGPQAVGSVNAGRRSGGRREVPIVTVRSVGYRFDASD